MAKKAKEPKLAVPPARKKSDPELSPDVLGLFDRLEKLFAWWEAPGSEKRPPLPNDAAGGTVFAQSRELSQERILLIARMAELYGEAGGPPCGGRDGVIVALQTAILLIGRLPMTFEEQQQLTAPLRDLQRSLVRLDRGIVDPVLKQARRYGHPEDDDRKLEFQARCTLAAELSIRLGKSKEEASKVVAKKASVLAHHLHITAHAGRKKQVAGFSWETVENWHERHTTMFREYKKSRKFTNANKQAVGLWLCIESIDAKGTDRTSRLQQFLDGVFQTLQKGGVHGQW